MKRDIYKIIFVFAGLTVLGVFTGIACRGDGIGLAVSGDPEGGGFIDQIQSVFDTNCTRCHSPGGIGFIQTGGNDNNGLDLTRGNAYGKLVNQPTFEEPGTAPQLRVAPGDPDGSYIIQKISSDSPKFGRRMPLDGPPYLSQADIQLIRDWITEGAPNK
ncbi:MAG: hypothetical protein ACE5IR_21955 [bacterium]